MLSVSKGLVLPKSIKQNASVSLLKIYFLNLVMLFLFEKKLIPMNTVNVDTTIKWLTIAIGVLHLN